MNKLKDVCFDIKLIVSEVDGIITEGMSPIDNMNNTLYKLYYMRDFEAINLLKKNYKFAFLSDANNVSYNIMRTRNIPFFWARERKDAVLGDIMRRYEVKPDQLMYIGCTFSDVKCMNIAALSVCPNDAAGPVLRFMKDREEQHGYNGILNIYGGGGVISEVYDLLTLTSCR